MELLSFFLGAAFVVVINGQATECDYDYICDDAVSLEDLVMSAPSPLACYEACRDYVDPLSSGKTCKHWTYYEEMGFGRAFDGENDNEVDSVDGKLRARGKPVCRRLESCFKRFSKSGCESAVGGVKCASGPGSCEACDKCDKLNSGSSFTAASWVCNINEPYRQDFIPPGTICRTGCPSDSWSEDGITNGPVKVKATCRSTCSTAGAKGEWELDHPAAVDSVGDLLSPTVDSECLCTPLLLESYQWPGADSFEDVEFFCSSPLVDGGSGDLDTLDSTSYCELFCHGKLTKTIYCEAGSFTSDVQAPEDVNCLNFPKECEYKQDAVNSEVCQCSAGNVCTKGQGCLAADGTCLDVCTYGPTALSDPCFCKELNGNIGVSCNAPLACMDDGTCGTPV